MEEAGTNNAIIEIGGCSDDQEAGVIPGAMRLLDGIYPVGIHIVTKFDFTDNQGILDVKTRSAVRAIEETMRRYWNLPLRTAYIRRYHVPESIPDDVLETACKKIAFKTQINPKRIVYVPNVEHQEDLDAYIAPGLQE